MSKRSYLVLAALVAGAAPLAAQRVYTTEPRRSEPDDRRPMTMMNFTTSRRAVIGVTVDIRPSANDSVGATLSGVTPGSPAAGAGLVGGDIITKFNGTILVERGRRTEQGDDEDPSSAPGLRLLDLASRMAPGDTVAVEWRHERQRKTARIVADAAPAMVYSNGGPDVRLFTEEGPGRFKYRVQNDFAAPGMPELDGMLERQRSLELMMPGMDGDHVFLRFGGPFGGIQMAPLNDDLGRYFGTTEGILVLDTPDTSAHVDLKGGDVILAIGDRKPTSVEHLFRILGSYQDDETISFDIMRDKHRMTIQAKADDLRASSRVRFLQRTLPDNGPEQERAPMPPRPAAPRRTPRSGT